jgi:hypothetical protein
LKFSISTSGFDRFFFPIPFFAFGLSFCPSLIIRSNLTKNTFSVLLVCLTSCHRLVLYHLLSQFGQMGCTCKHTLSFDPFPVSAPFIQTLRQVDALFLPLVPGNQSVNQLRFVFNPNALCSPPTSTFSLSLSLRRDICNSGLSKLLDYERQTRKSLRPSCLSNPFHSLSHSLSLLLCDWLTLDQNQK